MRDIERRILPHAALCTASRGENIRQRLTGRRFDEAPVNSAAISTWPVVATAACAAREPRPGVKVLPGRIPRVARLVALAHKFDSRRGDIGVQRRLQVDT